MTARSLLALGVLALTGAWRPPAAAAAEPAILWREDFEDANAARKLLKEGTVQNTRTYNKSGYAVQGAVKDDQHSQVYLKRENPPFFTTTKTSRLNMAVFVTAATSIGVFMRCGPKGYISYGFTPPAVNEWCQVSLPLGDFLNSSKFKIGGGATADTIRIRTDQAAELWLDDLVVTGDAGAVPPTPAVPRPPGAAGGKAKNPPAAQPPADPAAGKTPPEAAGEKAGEKPARAPEQE